jgi:hypothetical protein
MTEKDLKITRNTFVNIGLVISICVGIAVATQYVVKMEQKIENISAQLEEFQGQHNKNMRQFRAMIKSTVKHCCSEMERQQFYDDIYSLVYQVED